MRQNVGYDRYPQIIDGQREAIKNKEIEFVVIREYKDTIGYRKNIPYLNDNYKEIKNSNNFMKVWILLIIYIV